jgi:uracil-DNA glycosylase
VRRCTCPKDDETANLDFDPDIVVSAHPSSVLRGPPEDREKAFDAQVSDLRFAAKRLKHKR